MLCLVLTCALPVNELAESCAILGKHDYRVTVCTLPESEKNGNARGVNHRWTGGERQGERKRSDLTHGSLRKGTENAEKRYPKGGHERRRYREE